MRTLRSAMATTLALLIAIVPVLPAEAQSARAGIVTALQGTATATRSGLPQSLLLKFKDEVFLRDRITTGEQSLARLLLGGKAVVTVRERSVLTVTEVPGESTISLESGKVGLSVAKSRMAPGERIQIRTPNAVVAVRGTVVIVDVSRRTAQAGAGIAPVLTSVYLLSGSVLWTQLDPATGRPVTTPATLNPGQRLALAGAAPGTVQPMAPGEAQAVSADLQISGPPSTTVPNAGQLKQQALSTATTLLAALTGQGDVQFALAPATPLTVPTTPPSPTMPPITPYEDEEQQDMVQGPRTLTPPVGSPGGEATPGGGNGGAPPAGPEIVLENRSLVLGPDQSLRQFDGVTVRNDPASLALVRASTVIAPGAAGLFQVNPGADVKLASALVQSEGSGFIAGTPFAGAGSVPVTAPRGVAVSPDGTRAYVALATGALAVIDTTTNTLVGSLPLSGLIVSDVVVSPDGATVYVSGYLAGSTLAGAVAVVDVSGTTGPVILPVGGAQFRTTHRGLALSPDGARLYVTNAFNPTTGQSTVSVLDTASRTIVATIPLPGPSAIDVAVARDGSRVYVVIGETTAPRLFVVSAATNAIEQNVLLSGANPVRAALAPDGSRLYVLSPSQLDVFSTVATPALLATIPIAGGGGTDLAVSPNGRFAYVTTDQQIVVLDTVTRAAALSFALPTATEVAISPDGARLFVSAQGTAGEPGIAASLLVLGAPVPGAFLTVTGGALRATGPMPLLGFNGGVVAAVGDVVDILGGASVALQGSLVTAAETIVAAFDRVLDVHGQASLTTTSDASLLQFAGGQVTTLGGVVNIQDPGTVVTLAGRLVDASATTFTSGGSFVGVSDGARLETTRDVELVRLDGAFVEAITDPTLGARGLFDIRDERVTVPESERTRVTLAGPLLRNAGSRYGVGGDVLHIGRSTSFTANSAQSLIRLEGSGVEVAGNFLSHRGTATLSAAGFLELAGSELFVEGSLADFAGGPFSIAGSLLAATDSAVGLASDGIRILSTVTSTGAAPFIDLTRSDLAALGRLFTLGCGECGGTLGLAGGLLAATDSNVVVGDDMLLINGDARLTSTGAGPLIAFTGGALQFGVDTDPALIRVEGFGGEGDDIATSLQHGGALVQISAGARASAGPVLSMSAAGASAGKVLVVDQALLEASAPLLEMRFGSVLRTMADAIDLTSRATVTSAGPLIRLDASTLSVLAGSAVNVAGGSALDVTGDLITLSNGARLNVNGGGVLRVAGNSLASIGGALIGFSGGGGNTVTVMNGLCPAGSGCSTIGGVTFFFTGGASTANVSVTGTPLGNPALGTVNAPNSAHVIVDGAGSRVTIGTSIP